MFGLTPYERRNTIEFYNPFKELENFEKRFFSNNQSFPDFKTDIRDNGNEYILEAELPGFEKEDINLTIEKDFLTISAQHNTNEEKKDEKSNYICRERTYGSFSRCFDIAGIDKDTIEAKFKNGILELKLPKKAKSEPETKTIEIH